MKFALITAVLFSSISLMNVASGYSDADMKDIAAYIASLPGNFVIRK